MHAANIWLNFLLLIMPSVSTALLKSSHALSFKKLLSGNAVLVCAYVQICSIAYICPHVGFIIHFFVLLKEFNDLAQQWTSWGGVGKLFYHVTVFLELIGRIWFIIGQSLSHDSRKLSPKNSIFYILQILRALHSIRYILHNFGLVSIGEEFLSLDAETLIKIISEDKLKSSSEEQVRPMFWEDIH